MIRGYRKMLAGAIVGCLFLAVSWDLCRRGITAGSDPTALGVMCGGIGAALTGIYGTFVWGNVKTHEAQENGDAGKPAGS
jgi:hypothetical protein